MIIKVDYNIEDLKPHLKDAIYKSITGINNLKHCKYFFI